MPDSHSRITEFGSDWTSVLRKRLGVAGALIFIIAIFFEIYGGVARYVLDSIGLIELVYLPKILMLFYVAAGVLSWLIDGTGVTARTMAGSWILVATGMATGLANGLDWPQMIFGFSIFLPLLFGVQLGILASDCAWLTPRMIYVAFASVSAGVLIQYALGDVFWSGGSYAVNGHEMEVSRAWDHDGIDRLSGFSRISTQAGLQAATFGLMAAVLLSGVWRIALLPVVVVALGIAVITTTKSAVVALVVSAFALLYLRSRYFSAQLIATGVVMVGLPLYAARGDLYLDYSSPVSQFLFASFDARLTLTWPVTFMLVDKFGVAGLGIGMGGVGTPARTLGGVDASDATGELGLGYTDNLALYLYGNIGLPGLLVIAFAVWSIVWLCRYGSERQCALGCGAAVLLFAGVTVDMMEMLVAPMVFGVAIGAALGAATPRGRKAVAC